MTRSGLAKTLRFTSWLFASIPAFASSNGLPNFACGDYRVEGRLRQNNQGQFIVVVQEGSATSHELIVLGGSVSEKIKRLNTGVAMNVYVPRPIRSSEMAQVFLQGKLETGLALDSEEKLLKAGACKQLKRYQGG